MAVNYTPRTNYSPDEAAIRTILGEARGEGPLGQQAVANVINNRMEAGNFGGDIYQVIRPSQFNGFDTTTEIGSARWNTAADAWANRGQDVTGGSLFFANPSGSTASWALQLNPSNSLQIGNHYFTDRLGPASDSFGLTGQSLDPKSSIVPAGDPLNSNFSGFGEGEGWNYGSTSLDGAYSNPQSYGLPNGAYLVNEPGGAAPTIVNSQGQAVGSVNDWGGGDTVDTGGSNYTPGYGQVQGSTMDPMTPPAGSEYGTLDTRAMGNTGPDAIAPAGDTYSGGAWGNDAGQLDPAYGSPGNYEMPSGGGSAPSTSSPGTQYADAGGTGAQGAPQGAQQQAQPQTSQQSGGGAGDVSAAAASRSVPLAIVYHAKLMETDTKTATKSLDTNTGKLTKELAGDTQKITSTVTAATTDVTKTAKQITAIAAGTTKNLFVRGGLILLGFIFVYAGLAMFRQQSSVTIAGRKVI